MDENSLESCDPTVANVGCRFEMWRTGYPMTPLLNAVCFAWPATTFAAMRYASRLMERTLSSRESGVKRGEDQNRSTLGQTEMQMDYQGRQGTISETNYFLAVCRR